MPTPLENAIDLGIGQRIRVLIHEDGTPCITVFCDRNPAGFIMLAARGTIAGLYDDDGQIRQSLTMLSDDQAGVTFSGDTDADTRTAIVERPAVDPRQN